MATRDEFDLKALAETLVVDLENGPPQVDTKIEYRKNKEWVLLHRIGSGDWVKVPLQIVDLDDPKLIGGDFPTLPLRPGQRYEACSVPPGYQPDPGVPVQDWVVTYSGPDDRGAPPHVSVVALRKRPEPRRFFQDGNSRTHGTYHERDVLASTDVVGQLSLSTAQWIDAGDGMLVLPGPKLVVARGPQQSFAFVIDDLLPGTTYYELLLLMDEFGNWEFVTDTIETLKRKVEAEVTELFIVDDSDDASNGEAQFSFALQAGNPLLAKSNVVRYDNSNVETGKVAVPTPPGKCELGPAGATFETKDLNFYASAWEDDAGSVPIDDDDVASGTRKLDLPVGPGENVSGATASLTISGSDDWQVKVTYKYSVKYQ
jgi:hypothetical protein